MPADTDPSYTQLVDALIHRFEGMDDVRAHDHPHLPSPAPIAGHMPAATAEKHGRLLIGVAKTAAGLADAETADELTAAMGEHGPDGQRAVVWLCVPRTQEDAARDAYQRAGGAPDDELNEVLTVGVQPASSE